MNPTKPATPLMDRHAQRVEAHLAEHGPATTAELAEALNIPRRSIGNLLTRNPWRAAYRCVARRRDRSKVWDVKRPGAGE